MDKDLYPLLCLKVKIKNYLPGDFNFYLLYTMDAGSSKSNMTFPS